MVRGNRWRNAMENPENLTLLDRLGLLHKAGVHTGPLIQDLLDGKPFELKPMSLAQWNEIDAKARSQPRTPPMRRTRVPVEHPWLAANQSSAEPPSGGPEGTP